jgi:hypothetical protein
MSKSITIPTNLGYENSMTLYINGKTYNYTPGETVTVPDEVAALIEDMQRSMPKDGAVPLIQADWNENDETKLSYIRNRPFSSSGAEVFNTTGMSRITLGDIHRCIVQEVTLPEKNIQVYLDDTTTTLTYGVYDSLPGWGLNRSSIIVPLTEEVITAWQNAGIDMSGYSVGDLAIAVDEQGYSDIRYITESIVPVSDKYIPDTIARASDLEALEARVAALEGV